MVVFSFHTVLFILIFVPTACLLTNELLYMIVLWRYRYRLFRTDQDRTGTDNYTYSNGQWLGVYWFIRGAKWIYICTGQVNCEHWLVDHPRGWNAGLTEPGPMCGGGGEVQVTSTGSCSQRDAGWLAATALKFTKQLYANISYVHTYLHTMLK